MKIIKLSCLFSVIGISILLSACGPNEDGSVFSSATGGGGTSNTGIDTTGMIQLTTKPAASTAVLGYTAPIISGDGSTVLFISAEDYTGQNADNSAELFLISSNGTGLMQLTDSIVKAGVTIPVGSFDISDDGSVIVFDGDFDHLVGANTDFGREVFTINSDGTGLAQITNGASNDIVYSAHISSDGSVISYKKGSTGIYVYTLGAFADSQVISTNLTYSYSLSGDGTKIVVCSDADLTGGNADGSDEVFIVNTDGTGLAQLTSDAVQNSCDPRISDNASVVAFTSSADLVNGSNSDLNRELFVINSDGSGLAQLTATTTADGPRPNIAMSGDGTSIAFYSSGDLTGFNTSTIESIFLANADGSGLRQVSPEHDQAYESTEVTISNNAGSIVYQSLVDFTGGNADHNREVFIDTSF